MGNFLSTSVRFLGGLGALVCTLERTTVVKEGEIEGVWPAKAVFFGESGQLTYSEVRPVDLWLSGLADEESSRSEVEEPVLLSLRYSLGRPDLRCRGARRTSVSDCRRSLIFSAGSDML